MGSTTCPSSHLDPPLRLTRPRLSCRPFLPCQRFSTDGREHKMDAGRQGGAGHWRNEGKSPLCSAQATS